MEVQKKVNLNILIEEDVKKRFLAVAKSNDTTVSQLIRKFAKEYLEKNAQTKMFSK